VAVHEFFLLFRDATITGQIRNNETTPINGEITIICTTRSLSEQISRVFVELFYPATQYNPIRFETPLSRDYKQAVVLDISIICLRVHVLYKLYVTLTATN